MTSQRSTSFGVLTRLAALGLTATTVAVLYFWFAAVQLIMERQPEAVELGALRIKGPADPGGRADVVIGRDDLLQKEGANAAEAAHIRAIFADGAWSAGNVAESRRLSLRYSSGTVFDSARWTLAQGDRVVVRSLESTTSVEFAELSDRAAVLVLRDIAKPDQETAIELEFAGRAASLRRAGSAEVFTTCGGKTSSIPSYKRLIQGGAGYDEVLAEMGGSVFCSRPGAPARIAVAGAPGGLIQLIRRDGEFFIIPGAAKDPAAARVSRNVRVERGDDSQRLRAIAHPVSGSSYGELVELTAGRTDYAVKQDGADLVLTPVKNVHWFRKNEDGEAAGVEGGLPAVAKDKPIERTVATRARPPTIGLASVWGIADAAGRAPRAVSSLAALVCFAFVAGSAISALRGRAPFAPAASLGVGLAVTAAACLYTFDERAFLAFGHANALVLALAAWLLATLLIWRSCGRSWLGPFVWLLIAMTAASGNIVLAQLGYGADNTRWLGYFERGLAPLAMFGAGVAAAMALGNRAWLEIVGHAASGPGLFSLAGLRPGAAWSWWVRAFPILLTFVFLSIWLAFGEEEGIGGVIQPSEFIKVGALYLVCVAFATAYTRIVVDADAEVQAPGVLGMAFLVVALLVVFLLVPIAQHDFSPLVIVAGTMMAVVIVGGFVAFLNQTWRIATRRDRLPPREFFGRPPPRSFSWARFDGDALRLRARNIRANWARTGARWLFVIVCVAMMTAAWRASSYANSWLRDPAAVERADACRGGDSKGDFFCPWMNIGFWNRVLSYFDLRLDGGEAGNGVVDYPDEGQQVQRSRRSLAGAACLPPFDGLPLAETLEWASAPLRAMCSIDARALRLGDPNPEETMAVPVVQNDFIGSFVLGRFGEAAGAFLILLQGLISAVAACLAILIYRVWPGHEEDRARRHFLSLMCLGAGVLFALQSSLAWANAFGALPVMGQPMTFVSSAGSHMVLFALPLAIVLLVTVRIEHEPAGVIGPAELPRVPWRAKLNHWRRRGLFIEP